MGRFTEANTGYKYDKLIFWGVIIIILVLAAFIFNKYGWSFKQKFYFNCPGPSPCSNPLTDYRTHAYNTYTGQDYKKDCTADWCTQEFLMPGEYGTKPPEDFIYKNFSAISFFMVIIGLILNHLIHNKGKKPAITLNLPDKLKNKLKSYASKVKLEDD